MLLRGIVLVLLRQDPVLRDNVVLESFTDGRGQASGGELHR